MSLYDVSYVRSRGRAGVESAPWAPASDMWERTIHQGKPGADRGHARDRSDQPLLADFRASVLPKAARTWHLSALFDRKGWVRVTCSKPASCSPAQVLSHLSVYGKRPAIIILFQKRESACVFETGSEPSEYALLPATFLPVSAPGHAAFRPLSLRRPPSGLSPRQSKSRRLHFAAHGSVPS